MQLSASGLSFLLTSYIGYWCPYHYGCEDCPQIGCSNPWYPWLHIDFNVYPPNIHLYPLTWPSSNLVIKLDNQFQLLVMELWQLWGKYNWSIPYQSSMWLVKCPSIAIRFHNGFFMNTINCERRSSITKKLLMKTISSCIVNLETEASRQEKDALSTYGMLEGLDPHVCCVLEEYC